jgi:hypothetical protein
MSSAFVLAPLFRNYFPRQIADHRLIFGCYGDGRRVGVPDGFEVLFTPIDWTVKFFPNTL